ncbi:MAG: S-layer homology domain-containing protein [Ruminococcaceae bacterium]|nr:S-layer homology domain-containing protein [Oscillospiraceae bacterium]
MKKLIIFLLCSVALTAILPFGGVTAAAGNDVVYLKDKGTGDGSSAASPVGTLEDAFAALDLSKDCTVVVCGEFNQTKKFKYGGADFTGSVTFTSVYGGKDYAKTGGAVFKVRGVQFACSGKTIFRDIKIEALDSNYSIIGRHHPVIMGENVIISGSKLKGGNTSNSICIYGGYYSGYGDPTSSSKDTSITVLSGTNYYLVPYSRSMKGSYSGTANIKLGGTASAVVHGSAISASSPTLGTVKVEVADSATVKVFYGATEKATVGGYEFTWTGGTITEVQWNCKYSSGADLKVTGQRILNVSENVKSAANYGEIASQFDEVRVIENTDTYETVKNAQTVYLKSGAKGDGSSAETPLGSLDAAYNALDLSKDCTIVVCGKYTQTGNFDYGKDYTGSVTVTSVYGGTDYRKSGAGFSSGAYSFACRGTTVLENINFNCTGAYYLLVAQHNPVTIGEGVNITGAALKGGSVEKSFAVIGGYASGVGSATALDERDTNITVLSGSKLYIVAYSRQMVGDYPGTAHIKIGGNADVSVLHGSVAYYRSTIVGNVEIEICDNAKIGTFYGCTQVTTASSYRFIWRSGSINKFEWNCTATAGAKLTILEKTELYASEDVKKNSNFKAISAKFDEVKVVSEYVPREDSNGNTDGAKIPVIKNYKGYGEGLSSLGLLDASAISKDYNGAIARIDALVQVLRAMGKEDEALAGSYSHPFKDVPEWADKYVAYAYANKITYGVSETLFAPDEAATCAHYLTFLLRAMGYSDAAGEFVWSEPFALAQSVGITSELLDTSASFGIGNGYKYAWNALYATAKSGRTLKDDMILAGVFTENELAAAGKKAENAVEFSATKLKAENGYYVLPIATYEDKTKAGLLAQFVGFTSGYEFVQNSDGSATLSMPDEWFELCNGPFAEPNAHSKREDKLLRNKETGLWELWSDDDYSIDILDQYMLRDMYDKYGTFASRMITDGWVKYDVYDMGGGHRSYGAYGLMKKHGYLPSFAGSVEYGNMYSVNGEPYIGNETLGMSAAGMPNVAAAQARVFGSATSDRDPTRWLEYFTALISMGYLESDIPAMMREAQHVFVEGSWQWEVVDKVFEIYEKYPDDWRRAVIHATTECWQNHYDNSKPVAESSQNCAMILIGLLYGEGDFYETCKIMSLAGHGGDSTTPVGLSAAAVICGWEGIDEESKKIINDKLWQDGKGVIVNLTLDGIAEAYWMFSVNLPDRIGMQELLDLYKQNFESNLLANGGKIENGNYYIPENTLAVTDTVFADEFEHGTLDGYTVKGEVENTVGSYSGERGAKLIGGSSVSSIERTLTGLTPGASYRLSAFISSAADVTAKMYVVNGGEKSYVSVYDQAYYVKRELVFTATSDTAVIGFSIPAGLSSHKYAVIDEVYVIRVEEKSAGSVEFESKSATNRYSGTVAFDIKANEHKEYYLKITFENTYDVTVRGKITVNGKSYATAPFHPTGEEGMGVVYIPVLAEEKAEFKVRIDFASQSLTVHSAELVEIKDRW